MFKVKVITQGRCKETWLSSALAEYERRLQGKMQIEWMIVDNLGEALKEPKLIALDLGGVLLSSEALHDKLFSSWGLRPVFVIGGAEGLPPEVLKHASFRWSLSPLTFTHQIVRLLLVEQLYRAIEISAGSAYHKSGSSGVTASVTRLYTGAELKSVVKLL